MVRIEQEDNGKSGVFKIYEGDDLAGEMTYTWAGEDKFIIDHTGVEEEYKSKGYAKQLVLKGVEFAREKGLKIMPLCPYARMVFDRNPELADVRF